MALGKTIQEIRALPNPEFKSWQLYYLLEPFGFEDNEYRTAVLLAQLHNINAGKRKNMKKPKAFMRDMPSEILKYIRRKILHEQQPAFDLTTEEGRKGATDEMMKNFKAMFGNRMK